MSSAKMAPILSRGGDESTALSLACNASFQGRRVFLNYGSHGKSLGVLYCCNRTIVTQLNMVNKKSTELAKSILFDTT